MHSLAYPHPSLLTPGQGEIPTNMRSFWRFLLRKSLPASSLARLAIAVFGLGDSGYQLFNATAKKLHRRLEALGAKQLIDLGLGKRHISASLFASLCVFRVFPQETCV